MTLLGAQVRSPKAFNQRIYTLIKDAMDLKGDLTVTASEDPVEVSLHDALLVLAC